MASDSRSVLSRGARPPDLTRGYGPRVDQVVDVWLPASPAGATLVIFLHGGFWRSVYDRTHVAPLAEALAGAGYLVATPEYRRTGDTGGGWPETFDDVRLALSAVPALLAQLNPARTLVSGHSAGGHLALWGAGAVGGAVALAPVADLRQAYELDLDEGAVAELLGGTPTTVPERYARADPMFLLPLGVPVALVHGGRDGQVPVSFSQRYAQVASAAGDTVRLELLPEADHFAVIDPQSAAWPAVMAALTWVVDQVPATLTATGD